MPTTIQEIATKYKYLTYVDQDKKKRCESLYNISLSDAMIFIGCEPITCLQYKSFMRLRDTFLKGVLFNFRYAKSNIDPNGHYLYHTDLDNIKKLYFSISGLKYFSMVYPSPNLSSIILYYMELESEYLGFTRDAENFI
jgi:hypothetical protein